MPQKQLSAYSENADIYVDAWMRMFLNTDCTDYTDNS